MIAFRLPVEALEQVEEAAKRRAVSVNELAREALMSTLDEGNEVHRMALRMTTIESELSELRRDLAVATQAVLIIAGKFSPARNSAKGRVITLPIKGSSLSNSYLELAREDYYMGGGDPPGQWHGRGAGVLGLTLKAEIDTFERYSLTEKGLAQDVGREGRHTAWALTFSAPKSVSAARSRSLFRDEKEDSGGIL